MERLFAVDKTSAFPSLASTPGSGRPWYAKIGEADTTGTAAPLILKCGALEQLSWGEESAIGMPPRFRLQPCPQVTELHCSRVRCRAVRQGPDPQGRIRRPALRQTLGKMFDNPRTDPDTLSLDRYSYQILTRVARGRLEGRIGSG
jgi:hypothetical protein